MTPRNRLEQLHAVYGQSPWIDNLRRDYLASGHLDALINRGVRGLTSNPTIFQKAIQDSPDYDEQFYDLARSGRTTAEIYWDLVVDDIAGALRRFSSLYDNSAGTDGFVSVEVDPLLANDTEGTIVAARHLRTRLGAPNAMIKIPATKEGLPAIRQLIADGANVNVTLIFGLERYAEVIEAYLGGLEDLASDPNADLSNVQSVASFFISRVDSEVDPLLAQMPSDSARGLLGKAAVAQGRLAYRLFVESFNGPRWDVLRARGANLQRPLWASTSTKNPSYSDTLYVDNLIGPHTVNTLPDQTLEAWDDHGSLQRTVDSDLDEIDAVWRRLADLGLDMTKVAEKLEVDGVASFQASFIDLLSTLESKRLGAKPGAGSR